MTMPADRPLVTEFTILIDQREKCPFAFANLRADSKHGNRPILVRCESQHLETGDYTLAGYDEHVAVERKSKEDLYSTLGQHRARFEAELRRLNEMQFAMVVVEADWAEIIGSPPERSALKPKTIYRSVLAWQQRFTRVHWMPCPGRAFAETTAYRALERFWMERHDAPPLVLADGTEHE